MWQIVAPHCGHLEAFIPLRTTNRPAMIKMNGNSFLSIGKYYFLQDFFTETMDFG